MVKIYTRITILSWCSNSIASICSGLSVVLQQFHNKSN